MEEIFFLKDNSLLDKIKRQIEKVSISRRNNGNLIKKLINYSLVNVSTAIKNPKVWGKPFYLIIEPTNICNLKCPLCPTGEGTLSRQDGLMDFSIFKKAIDELGDYLLELNITNYGEPFIHNQLCQMISYSKKKAIKVSVGTNGHYFNNGADVERFILSGVDKVYVSLDGTTQESYSKYRVGGSFQKVVEGLRLLSKIKSRLKSSLPFIELQFIVMRHNEDELSCIRKIAKGIGAGRLVLKPVSFNISEWDRSVVKERFKEFMPKSERFRLYDLKAGNLCWKRRIKNVCGYLWRGAVVLWDGSIVACCLDPRGDYKMGEVKDGFRNVWNSQRYISLRRQVLKDKKKLDLCSNCLGT